MLSLVLPIFAQAAVEQPRTVNDIALGDAEAFATPGPATVCIREMVVAPQAGETAYLAYSGIHNGGIRLLLSNGKFVDFTYGEIFRDMRKPGQGTSVRAKDMRVYLYDDEREIRYQVHIKLPETEWDGSGWQPLVNVSGTALSGNRTDAHLFERLSFNLDVKAPCDRRYNFGWGVILEGEPIDETNAQ